MTDNQLHGKIPSLEGMTCLKVRVTRDGGMELEQN